MADRDNGRNGNIGVDPDDFWSVGDLTPKRAKGSPAPRERTAAHEIVIPVPGKTSGGAPTSDTSDKSRGEAIPPRSTAVPAGSANGSSGTVIRHYVPPHTAADDKPAIPPESEYTPVDSLIHSVRIFPWHTNYSYYEAFCRSAVALEGKTAPESQHVPFFSYMPQYLQMNSAQLNYYLWLRSRVREGDYPAADYSYILLMIYEIINLSDIRDVNESCRLLVDIWLAYREEYPRLDVQLSDWLCDFCLINRTVPPFDRLSALNDRLMSSASLKEFYVSCAPASDAYADILVRYCSNYDYRKSKFAVGENVAVYDRHMRGVVTYVTSHGADSTRPLSLSGLQDSKMSRDAYTGALCSPRVKKRIEIEYCSFSRSHELRFLMTDLMKYAENRIRGALGIKSRLSHGALPVSVREAADAYFTSVLPTRRAPSAASEPEPEYEKLYEPSGSVLSLESAARIEELSWETTERLIEAFDTPDSDIPASVAAEPVTPLINDTEADSTGNDNNGNGNIAGLEAAPGECEYDDAKRLAAALGDSERRFIAAAAATDASAQACISREAGRLADAFADEINGMAADIFGDVILEDAGGFYSLIPDYADVISAVFNE